MARNEHTTSIKQRLRRITKKQNTYKKKLMERTHKYLQYLREQEYCSLCYKHTPTEPHHIDQIGMGRDRKKNLREHFTAIPVCRACHTEYHNLGGKMYSIKHQINPYEIALYWLSKFLMKKEDT